MGPGHDEKKSVNINEYGEIADTQTSEYDNTNNVSWDQFYNAVGRMVEESFDRLKHCNDWSGRGSVYHENWEEYSLDEDLVDHSFNPKCCNSNDPQSIKEYLAQDGFNVARDRHRGVWYISKSNSYYMILDGCLDIVGNGPHEQGIKNSVRSFLEFEDVKKWEDRSIKITEKQNSEGAGISVVGRDGDYVDDSTRRLDGKYDFPD